MLSKADAKSIVRALFVALLIGGIPLIMNQYDAAYYGDELRIIRCY